VNNNLPFERGSTYFEADTNRINTNASLDTMLGQMFTVKNNGQAGIGDNNQENTLMVVRNSSGGALTPGRGVRYAATIGEVTGYAAAGKFGHITDEVTAGTIVDDDIFYVVVDGPVNGLSLTGATYAIGEAAVFGATGHVDGLTATAAGTDHVVGIFCEALGTASEDTSVLISTGGRYANGGPAAAS